MQCQRCGYALWNLSKPQCPDCGASFDIRDYRFSPGTVAFACQHCGYLHYGVGEHQLPTLDNQIFCQGCAQDIATCAMRVIPLVDDPESMLVLSHQMIPWQRVGQLGFFSAWGATLKMALAAPTQLIRRFTPEGVWSDAYTFALATTCVGILAHFFAAMAYRALLGQSAPVIITDSLRTVALLLFSAVIPLVNVFILATPAHIVLIWTGDVRYDLHATLRSVLYGHAAMVLIALPFDVFIAFAVAQIATVVVSSRILMHAQGVSSPRVFLAIMIIPLLLGSGYVILNL